MPDLPQLSYRFYPRDAAGRLGPSRDMACSDDAAALAMARELLGGANDLEIWHGARRVGCVPVPAGIGTSSDIAGTRRSSGKDRRERAAERRREGAPLA